jgi:hypothetical protein
LISFEDIISVVLDYVGHKLGGKYKLGVHILIGLLKTIHAYDRIVSLIADGIRSITGIQTLDEIFPVWSQTIVPLLEGVIGRAQSSLVEVLRATLGRVPGIEIPEPRVNLQLTSEPMPEVQPYPAGAVRPISLPAEALSGGRPLPPRLRARAELGFGHDFSHVRLHSGPGAIRMNRRAGARALTSGSHILLGDGVTPTSPAGNELLRHELAHVVQQTGPRPLGRPANPLPQSGRPGRGLSFQPSAEAAAQRAARQSAYYPAGRHLM